MGNAYVVLYIYGPPRFLKDGRYFPLIDRVYARKNIQNVQNFSSGCKYTFAFWIETGFDVEL